MPKTPKHDAPHHIRKSQLYRTAQVVDGAWAPQSKGHRKTEDISSRLLLTGVRELDWLDSIRVSNAAEVKSREPSKLGLNRSIDCRDRSKDLFPRS